MDYAKPSRKSTLFTVSIDEWNMKEDTGKSMKNCMYCGMAKQIFQAEATLKIKPIAIISVWQYWKNSIWLQYCKFITIYWYITF